MNQKEKLSVIMKHWIEHNGAHLDEYSKWAQTADAMGLDLVEAEIKQAMTKISLSNEHLKKALEALSL